MRIYFTEASGTPALANCRLTPMPQSITNGVSFTTTRLAGLDGPTSTRGPPLVPRNTILVRGFAGDCASAAGAAHAGAVQKASLSASRPSVIAFSQHLLFDATLTYLLFAPALSA